MTRVVIAQQFFFVVAAAYASAAAAVSGFQHHRVADLGSQFARFFHILQVAFTSRYARDSGSDHGGTGLYLVAHLGDDIRVGADELDSALVADV